MRKRALRRVVVTAVALSALAVALVVSMATRSSASPALRPQPMAVEPGEGTAVARPGTRGAEGLSAEDFRAAIRAYPADQVEVAWVENARATASRLAARTPRTPPDPNLLDVWQNYGPQKTATVPGFVSWAGARYTTAGRISSIAISSACGSGMGPFPCRMWVGSVGGGVWRTDDATAPVPAWTPVGQLSFGINAIGDIILDPTDPSEQTLYAGTGEPNNCSSGCEAGVGLYRSTNGGNTWTKLAGTCVNALLTCTTVGGDSFIGRGISEIVVDPTNPSHLIVGTANAVRSVSHVVEGPEAQVRDEPGSNPTALYESADGGATFRIIWNPYTGPSDTPLRRGIMDVGLDPLDPRVVYASAIARGVWRRCPAGAPPACGGESGSGATDFKQVFAPRHTSPLGRERTHFDPTVKNGKTRIYLTTGEVGSAPYAGEPPSSFWRTDNANVPAATLIEPPVPATSPPGPYGGWWMLTANTTASPYWATRGFCEPQCWYDQDVYTPKNPMLPDTVYVLGSYAYGELPCYTKGVGCRSGISNGRAVLYSTTAGDPDPANLNRTFTDMTYDAQNVPMSSCALAFWFSTLCLAAHDAIHPDQHEIVVNPARPTQFFEASDGGMIRSSGSFTNLSRACQFRGAPTVGVPSLSGNSLTQCQRLLSRIPSGLGDINEKLSNTLQFVGLAVDPLAPCNVIGGTQDNGTWMPVKCTYDLASASDNFTQVIYGDGGNPGVDTYYDQSLVSNNNTWLFNGFAVGATSVNFRGGVGGGDHWLDVYWPQLVAGEPFDFYWPQIADPNPPFFDGTSLCTNGPQCRPTHPIYSGGQHVWRSWAWGAGHLHAPPQDVVPDIAYYTQNCPDIKGVVPGCGDFVPMGGSGSSGDLTGTFYGADRTGLQVSWIARRAADRQTMWAGTGAGRLFVTRNADAIDPAAVVWYRVDNLPTPSFANLCTGVAHSGVNCSPNRHLNAIYPDPEDPNVAYVAYSGYRPTTPTTPGHVFRVSISPGSGAPTGATFKDLEVEPATGDLPVNDVVMNDANRVLYAATDFGVVKGTPCATTCPAEYNWFMTPGMPRFEVAHLAIVPGQRDACRVCGPRRLMYAATHSMGIWQMNLS